MLLKRLFARRRPSAEIPLQTIASVELLAGGALSMGALVVKFVNGKQAKLPIERVDAFGAAVRERLDGLRRASPGAGRQ